MAASLCLHTTQAPLFIGYITPPVRGHGLAVMDQLIAAIGCASCLVLHTMHGPAVCRTGRHTGPVQSSHAAGNSCHGVCMKLPSSPEQYVPGRCCQRRTQQHPRPQSGAIFLSLLHTNPCLQAVTCEGQSGASAPEACNRAHSDAVFLSSCSSFVSQSVLSFLLVSF